jgi:hypothetical protein
VNSEAERFVRRTERKERIQTLVKKFQSNAQQNADKRGAVVVKERFKIPSFVPKFDSNEEKKRSQLILKPSQMFLENSVSSSGLDSTESSLLLREEDEEEEEGDLFEMSTRSSVSDRGGGTGGVGRGTGRNTVAGARGGGGGGGVGGGGEALVLPPIDSALGLAAAYPQKYSMLERIINKEAEDQVITQLTLRMGGEPINVVVYWLPKEECLRLNAFCFQG